MYYHHDLKSNPTNFMVLLYGSLNSTWHFENIYEHF